MLALLGKPKKLLRNSLKLSSRCEGRKGRKKEEEEERSGEGGLGESLLLFFAGAADHHPVLQN
jgi:hypothetical protein